MSTPRDMAESEVRDSYGNPLVATPTTRPRATIHAPITGDINQNTTTDNSVNKALPWVAIACLLAGMSLGVSLMSQPITDAKIEKAKAELRAEYAEEIAIIRVEAHNAASVSEVWRNRVNKLEAESNARR